MDWIHVAQDGDQLEAHYGNESLGFMKGGGFLD